MVVDLDVAESEPPPVVRLQAGELAGRVVERVAKVADLDRARLERREHCRLRRKYLDDEPIQVRAVATIHGVAVEPGVLVEHELGQFVRAVDHAEHAQIGLMGGEVADAVLLPGMGRERPELGQTIQLEVGGVRGPGQGDGELRRRQDREALDRGRQTADPIIAVPLAIGLDQIEAVGHVVRRHRHAVRPLVIGPHGHRKHRIVVGDSDPRGDAATVVDLHVLADPEQGAVEQHLRPVVHDGCPAEHRDQAIDELCIAKDEGAARLRRVRDGGPCPRSLAK